MNATWSWVRGGIALGLLSVFALLTLRPIGTSTAYVTAAAMLLRPFAPNFVATNAYLQTVPTTWSWELMLVLGAILGGWLAARVAERMGRRLGQGGCGVNVPPRRRPWPSFLGGFLILFGARMAGGCTSGHIVSGIGQLATSGMLFAAAVFAAAIPTALLLRGRPRLGSGPEGQGSA